MEVKHLAVLLYPVLDNTCILCYVVSSIICKGLCSKTILTILQRHSKLFHQDCMADISHRNKLVFRDCLMLLSSSYHILCNCYGVSLTQFICDYFITTANLSPRVLVLSVDDSHRCLNTYTS
jgi:hypothetical protein